MEHVKRRAGVKKRASDTGIVSGVPADAFRSRLAGELSTASDAVWLARMSTGLGLTIVVAFLPLPVGGGTACADLGLLAGLLRLGPMRLSNLLVDH